MIKDDRLDSNSTSKIKIWVFGPVFIYMNISLLHRKSGLNVAVTDDKRQATTISECSNHWRRQLWDTGARAPVNFQQYFSAHFGDAQSL